MMKVNCRLPFQKLLACNQWGKCTLIKYCQLLGLQCSVLCCTACLSLPYRAYWALAQRVSCHCSIHSDTLFIFLNTTHYVIFMALKVNGAASSCPDRSWCQKYHREISSEHSGPYTIQSPLFHTQQQFSISAKDEEAF